MRPSLPLPTTLPKERAEKDEDHGGSTSEGLGGCSVGNMKALERGVLGRSVGRLRQPDTTG